jgi:hypothetical protein
LIASDNDRAKRVGLHKVIDDANLYTYTHSTCHAPCMAAKGDYRPWFPLDPNACTVLFFLRSAAENGTRFLYIFGTYV